VKKEIEFGVLNRRRIATLGQMCGPTSPPKKDSSSKAYIQEKEGGEATNALLTNKKAAFLLKSGKKATLKTGQKTKGIPKP